MPSAARPSDVDAALPDPVVLDAVAADVRAARHLFTTRSAELARETHEVRQDVAGLRDEIAAHRIHSHKLEALLMAVSHTTARIERRLAPLGLGALAFGGLAGWVLCDLARLLGVASG